MLACSEDPVGTAANDPRSLLTIEFGNLDANLRFLDDSGLLRPGRKVLEIGCGRGTLLHRLTAQGLDVVGVETSETRIQESRALYGALPIEQISGTALPFPDEQFDLVLSFDVLEHIPDTLRHLLEVRRVLKPGGWYLLQTPNKWTNSIFETIRWRSVWKWRIDHCSLQTYRQLRRRLSGLGFEAAFADVKVVTPFFREKVRRYLGRTGLALLAVANPDRLPLYARTNFYVRARKPAAAPAMGSAGEDAGRPSDRIVTTAASPLLSRAVRIAVAIGLSGYILWRSDPRAILSALAGADWRLIAVAILLVLIDRALMAYRWVVLLCIVDPAKRPPLAALLRIFFVSSFVGTFLPSVGGDALRAYSTAKLDVRGSDAVASVFMDRILGVASILIVALAGLLFVQDLARNSWVVGSLAATAGICLLALLLVFNHRTTRAAAAILARLPAALQHAGDRMLESIRRYAAYRGQLANVLVCSVAVQVIRILQAYYIGRGLGIAAGLTVYFGVVPLILLIVLLPVTFNGIGTSQAAFLWFFGGAGATAAAAFTLSVLFVALGIVGNLPGGILYAWGRGRTATIREP